MTLAVRPARESDQASIYDLARNERVNPTNLHWFNFFVASIDARVIGIVQLRRHRDGSRELGTLIVKASHRGNGLGQQVVDAVMAQNGGRIYTITRASNASTCDRWGLQVLDAKTAPRAVKRNYMMGAYGGRLIALVQRRRANKLVIMERPALAHRRQDEFLAAQWF